MNYLAHLLLAGDDPQRQLGGFIADFVRGHVEILAQQYPSSVLQGIVEHRRIDSFSEGNPHFLTSRSRVSAQRRRVSGIIVDVAYDHFLSIHWDRFSSRPKSAFIQGVYRLLEENHELLPEKLREIAPRLIADDWLGSYRELWVLGVVFDRMSLRIKRTNSLGGALVEVEREYAGLEEDFLAFFQQAIAYIGENQS